MMAQRAGQWRQIRPQHGIPAAPQTAQFRLLWGRAQRDEDLLQHAPCPGRAGPLPEAGLMPGLGTAPPRDPGPRARGLRRGCLRLFLRSGAPARPRLTAAAARPAPLAAAPPRSSSASSPASKRACMAAAHCRKAASRRPMPAPAGGVAFPAPSCPSGKGANGPGAGSGGSRHDGAGRGPGVRRPVIPWGGKIVPVLIPGQHHQPAAR